MLEKYRKTVILSSVMSMFDMTKPHDIQIMTYLVTVNVDNQSNFQTEYNWYTFLGVLVFPHFLRTVL